MLPRASRAEWLRTTIVGPADAPVLGQLLSLIDPTFFRPHPMTLEEASRIARHQGRDLYLLGSVSGEAVGYGMLRGWDEGYAIPSLGVGIRRDMTRMGYGRAMIRALHDAGRERGSSTIRLRVNPSNVAALTLYRSVGYREWGIDRGEIVMHFDL